MTRTFLPACLAALFITVDGHAQETIELPPEDRPLALELADVYRIGSASAVADWELLNKVRGAGFDAAGNLYLLNSPNRVVTVGPAGNLLGQFGRTGGGPGEFAEAGQLDVLPSGRIVVADMRRLAFHVFDPEGVFERMVRMELIPDPNVFPDLYYWGRAEVFGARPARRGAAIFSDGIRKIMRTDLSSDKARVEPFVEAWAPPGTEMKFGSLADVTSEVWGFVPPLVFDALPGGGIAYSDSSAYAIKVTGPSGQVLRILRRPIVPQPVTDRLKRAEIDRRLAELSPNNTGGDVPPRRPGADGGIRIGPGASDRRDAIPSGGARATRVAHHLGGQPLGSTTRRGTRRGPRTDRRAHAVRPLSGDARWADADAGRIRPRRPRRLHRKG